MKQLHLTICALLMAIIALASPAKAHDVMINHITKQGKIERLIVDSKQLPEVEKAIKEGKSVARFKSPMRDPAGDPDPQEGFKVLFAVEDEPAPEGLIYEPWKVYVCKGDGNYGREYYNYSYYPDEETIEQGYAWGCYVPEGEYTVILCSDVYKKIGEDGIDSFTSLYVVKENVKITGDTTITFRQSDAKNCITASFILPDGSKAPGDCYLRDSNGELIGVRDDLYIRSNRSFVNINGDYSLNLGNYGIEKLDLVYI